MCFYISEYGIKIKNISAGMLYDVNLGIRDYFTYTDAMLNNSLFSFYLQRNGLNVYKGNKKDTNSKNESTIAKKFIKSESDMLNFIVLTVSRERRLR